MMEDRCNPSLDRISELPCSVSQSILMLLPLRDMVRTSVLSKHWRYQWAKVPQLVFEDDPKYVISREERYRYSSVKVVEILLLHHGPILKFILDMTAWPTCSALNSIIPFLSRNGIKELTLLMPNNTERYKLPSSMFSSLNLRHLSLSSCVLQPSSFVAFNNLVVLELSKVELDPNVSISSCLFLESFVLQNILTNVELLSIDAPNLKKFHFEGRVIRMCTMNTPVLQVLWLNTYTGHYTYTGNSSSDFMSLLLSLPLLKNLFLTYTFLTVLVVGNTRDKLPKLLSNLEIVEFGRVDLCDMDELTSVLWFIRSSPNLRKLKIGVMNLPEPVTPLVEEEFLFSQLPMTPLVEGEFYLKMQDRSYYSLTKLQDVEMILSTQSSEVARFIEFSKFILDISPALETLLIKPDLEQIDAKGYKKLVELACYPRASSKAKIVYAGLESIKMTLG